MCQIARIGLAVLSGLHSVPGVNCLMCTTQAKSEAFVHEGGSVQEGLKVSVIVKSSQELLCYFVHVIGFRFRHHFLRPTRDCGWGVGNGILKCDWLPFHCAPIGLCLIALLFF